MKKLIGYFFDYIKNKNRFVIDSDCKEILSTLLTIAENHKIRIVKDTILYRSQKGCSLFPLRLTDGNITWEARPFEKERMTPWSKKAKEGRVNPKGLPCLYLAEDEFTAIQEMHPLPHQLLTIAEFSAAKDLNIIALYEDIELGSEDDKWFWKVLGNEFSRPVVDSDDIANYAPTQYLASHLKNHGFDGIAYKSFFNKKNNYAIFNPENFQFKRAGVKSIVSFPAFAKDNVAEVKSNESIILDTEMNGQTFHHQSNSYLLSGYEFIDIQNI